MLRKRRDAAVQAVPGGGEVCPAADDDHERCTDPRTASRAPARSGSSRPEARARSAVRRAIATYDGRTSGAAAAWRSGYLGTGVGVAVIDTGISEMNDLEGRIVHGPDLSGEGTLVDT